MDNRRLFLPSFFVLGGRGLKSHKMTRRLGGDRKTEQQQEMFGVDSWPSVCQFFHFPNRKIFPSLDSFTTECLIVNKFPSRK